MDLPSDLPGSDARRRVPIERCTPCANPHDSSDMPKCLPAGLTQYVLNNFSKKSPPYHVTQDDVSAPLQRLEVEKITGHQSVRGRGGVIAVLYKTHWVGLSEPSWEREMDLHLSRSHILRYWAGTPDQHRQANRLYRRMWIGAAQRELSRNNGERFSRRATHASYARSGSAATTIRCSPGEPTFGTRATMGYGGLEKSARVRRRMEFTWTDF